MNQQLLDYLSSLLGTRIKKQDPIAGGDSSSAYLIQTSTDRFFLKLNPNRLAYSMFLTEQKGLEAIAQSNTIACPNVYHCAAYEGGGILLMEYIESRRPSSKDYSQLGHQLAQLHQTQRKAFGWEQDNFIGALHQSNTAHQDWTAFYLEERILPQIQLAKSKQLLQEKDIPKKEKMQAICQELFAEISPTLLHGDLWSGNYLISTEGRPYLIDPAVYYGHREVDIAMTKLFGGFGADFYAAYWEHFSRDSNETARNDLYQLYYLLVHLNLFGASYYNSVKGILGCYFF